MSQMPSSYLLMKCFTWRRNGCKTLGSCMWNATTHCKIFVVCPSRVTTRARCRRAWSETRRCKLHCTAVMIAIPSTPAAIWWGACCLPILCPRKIQSITYAHEMYRLKDYNGIILIVLKLYPMTEYVAVTNLLDKHWKFSTPRFKIY